MASFYSVVVTLALFAVLLVLLGRRIPKARVELNHAATSCLTQRHSWLDMALMVFRCTVAAYAASIGAICDTEYPKWHFCFYTVWSWFLLMFYFSLAAVSTALHKKGVGKPAGTEPTPAWTLKLARVSQLVFSTAAAAALMVDVVLWGLLFPTDKTPGKPGCLSFCSYNQHAANLVVVIVELFLNNVEIRMQDLVVAAWWPLIYCVFTFLRVGLDPGLRDCMTQSGLQHCKTDLATHHMVWPYFMMDTSKPFAAAWMVALILLFCLAYAAMCSLSRCAKTRFSRRALPNPHSEAFDSVLSLQDASQN